MGYFPENGHLPSVDTVVSSFLSLDLCYNYPLRYKARLQNKENGEPVLGITKKIRGPQIVVPQAADSVLGLRGDLAFQVGVFVFAVVFIFFPITGFFTQYLTVVFHELGHAFAAWSCGYKALPVPFFTFTSEEPSWVARVCYFVLCAVALLSGYNHRSRAFVVFVVFLLALFFYCNMTLKPDEQDTFFVWGGHAGEFVLPTILLLWFPYRLPPRIHWDVFRYPAFIVAMISALRSWRLWFEVKNQLAPPPTHGVGSVAADYVRLLEGGYFTAESLIENYLNLAALCFGLILINFCYWLWRGLRPAARS